MFSSFSYSVIFFLLLIFPLCVCYIFSSWSTILRKGTTLIKGIQTSLWHLPKRQPERSIHSFITRVWKLALLFTPLTTQGMVIFLIFTNFVSWRMISYFCFPTFYYYWGKTFLQNVHFPFIFELPVQVLYIFSCWSVWFFSRICDTYLNVTDIVFWMLSILTALPFL